MNRKKSMNISPMI